MSEIIYIADPLGRAKNIESYRYGHWIVLKYLGREKKRNQNTIWLCRCDCGYIKAVRGHHLIHNRSTKCKFCADKESSKRVKHGFCKTKTQGREAIYKIWEGILARCYKPYTNGYQYYGGKGVTVCEEWRSPEVFIQWALNSNWTQGKEIHRLNKNGNYSANNCAIIDKKNHLNIHKKDRDSYGKFL